MPQFFIEEVYLKDSVYPTIVHFQNGYVRGKLKSKENLFLRNESNGNNCVAVDINDMVYTGEEEQEDVGKTLVLVRNQSTGKVRIVEVGNIELKPVIKSSLDVTEVTDTSYLELSRKFGSKKHKQIMEHREKLKINVTTVTEQMQNVTDTIQEEKLDITSYSTQDSNTFYTPPMNREATTVRDVYDIYDILTNEQFDKIYSEIENTDYKKELFPFLQSISAKSLSPEHTVLLVYANSLLKLFATILKDITKKNFVACPHSVTLNEIILQNFLSHNNGKCGRSPQYKDKSLCHALVFILLINDYKFNFNDLCNQLKLTPRTVTAKVMLTGATLVASGDKKIAQLKLPLNKPPIRRKSAKF